MIDSYSAARYQPKREVLMSVTARNAGGKAYVVAEVTMKVHKRKHKRSRFQPYKTLLALLFDTAHKKHDRLPWVVIRSESGSPISEERFASEKDALVAMDEFAETYGEAQLVVRDLQV